MSGLAFVVRVENGLEIELENAFRGDPVLVFRDVEDGEVFRLPVEVVDISESDNVIWYAKRDET